MLMNGATALINQKRFRRHEYAEVDGETFFRIERCRDVRIAELSQRTACGFSLIPPVHADDGKLAASRNFRQCAVLLVTTDTPSGPHAQEMHATRVVLIRYAT